MTPDDLPAGGAYVIDHWRHETVASGGEPGDTSDFMFLQSEEPRHWIEAGKHFAQWLQEQHARGRKLEWDPVPVVPGELFSVLAQQDRIATRATDKDDDSQRGRTVGEQHQVPKKTHDDYWDACQFLEHCQNFGFELHRVLDGKGKDVDAAERLLAFVDHVQKGLPQSG